MTELWSRLTSDARLRPSESRIAWLDVAFALVATAVTQYWLVQRADYWGHASLGLAVLVGWSPLLIAIRRIDPALALGGLLVGSYVWTLLAGGVPWPLLAGCLLAVWSLPTRWGTSTGLVLTGVLVTLPLVVDVDRVSLRALVHSNVYMRIPMDNGSSITLPGIANVARNRLDEAHWPWWASVAIAVFGLAVMITRRRRGIVAWRRTAVERVEDLLDAVRPSSGSLTTDVLLGVALTTAVLVELWSIRVAGSRWTAPGWIAYAVVFASLALAVRRYCPIVPVVVIGAAAWVSYWHSGEIWTALFALVVALYSVGTARPSLRWSVPPAIVVLAALPVIQVDLRWPVNLSLVLLVPVCAGIAVRLYRRNREAVRRETELEQAAVEREAQQVVLTERTHIARDLHDGIAHAVNLMVIQAETGPDLVRRGEADVLAGFERIGDAGRRALSELDRLLSALRDADGVPDPQLAPQPGLAELRQLVTDVLIPVELDLTGDQDRPSASHQLTAYRVVQEALTNAVRHADGTKVTVMVDVRVDGIAVEVVDDGVGFDPAVAGRGRHGLAGMRERIRVHHGTLAIDSAPGAGTTITAWIPVGAAR